jgi:acyl-CoA thioesterase-1
LVKPLETNLDSKVLKYLFLIICFIIYCKEDVSKEEVLKSNSQSKKVIFFGDSLTAGLGLENPEDSFPNLLFERIKKTRTDIELVNAGVSGDTTSGGLSRLDWVISQGVDYFILELGANDGMRGVPSEVIESNLKEIIQRVRKKNPKVKILLVRMYTFPNFGPVYTKKFAQVYPKVAKEMKVTLTPFLLEKVAGQKELNQKDGIHPTKEGHQILANTLWSSFQKLLANE